jgi:hypothetical protein
VANNGILGSVPRGINNARGNALGPNLVLHRTCHEKLTANRQNGAVLMALAGPHMAIK